MAFVLVLLPHANSSLCMPCYQVLFPVEFGVAGAQATLAFQEGLEGLQMLLAKIRESLPL
ncbi:hypothetical protein GCM10011396_13000 [Undibacterium terreum]|uniref:Uncharacterized protein n=1 Tax=Undibacterium terreum TaxID=1224302 RepID=A0A916UBJ7_9BURK|nr:hypothetical protein GCM10011396_13000 [Undibacterium terreum]